MDLMSVRKLSGAERIYLCKVKVAEVGLVLLIFVLKNWDIVFKQITFIILVVSPEYTVGFGLRLRS